MGSVNYGRMSGVQIWELHPRVIWKLTKSALQYGVDDFNASGRGTLVGLSPMEAHRQALTR